MVNHSLLKLALFLSAGAVAMNLHALDLNIIRGWGRNKPVLKLVFLVAAIGISGVPGFNGYLSKTLLHEGLLEALHSAGTARWPEWVFLVSGGLTFAYMSKLFLCIFVEQNADPSLQMQYDQSNGFASPLSQAVLLCSAAALLPWGIPKAALFLAGRMTGAAVPHFSAFSLESLSGAIISLSIGLLVYLFIVLPVLRRGGRYQDLWPAWLDLEDMLYRPLLLRILPGLLGKPAQLFGENQLLRPLCKGLVFLGSTAGRALDHSTDAVILLLRRSALREVPVQDGMTIPPHKKQSSLYQALRTALSEVVDNFSFAMTIACAGVVFVFLLLLFFQ